MEATDHGMSPIPEVELVRSLEGDDTGAVGRALDSYIEAQVHGPVEFGIQHGAHGIRALHPRGTVK